MVPSFRLATAVGSSPRFLLDFQFHFIMQVTECS